MLVIDGAGRLTYNCKSGGGLRFDKVDNVVCRNIDFINFANGVEAYSPDELSAITFLGDSDVAARNLYVENCRMNGVSTSQADKKAYYSVITKNSENVYIVGSHIEGCYCIPLKMVDCGMLALVRNYIRADYSYGIIGHPALCTLSNCKVLIAEDNEFTGDTAEYYFCCERTERMYFRRNTWHGGRGRAIDMSNTQTAVKEFVFESNLSYDMIKSPSAGWVKELFSVSLLESLSLLNNTFVMSGEWYYQYILRADAVGTANIYNNILVGDSGQTGDGRFVEGYYFDTLRALNSGNNLYQFPVKDASAGIAHRNYITVVNTNNNADSLTMKGTERGSLTALNALGYETGSNLVAPSVTLLDAEYRPKANFSYYSNDGYVPFADADYKAKAVSDNSRGCYNLAGMAIDEVNDATEGYTGIDYDEGGCAGFSSAAQHPVIAESVLLVMHNTRNRERFIRMSVIGKQHEYLMLGRYGLLRVMPVLDGDGEYVEDELYTVNIE